MSHTIDVMEEENRKLREENKQLRKTEPEWTRYFEESMRQILEQKQKLEAIKKENNILRMYEVDRSTKRQQLEAILDITNQTGTAMTRLIKIREVLGE